MPTRLQLRFPGRRYHATPWDAHVNEGQVEWPPSPWRLLRALLSTGFTKRGWPPEGPPPAARRLIERLASQPPVIWLPPVTLAHSRHYVEAGPKKPLILDTWANVDGGALEVAWPVDLEPEARAILADLAVDLGYLGRAESWVSAGLLADDAPAPVGSRCAPSAGGPPGPGYEPVLTRCPVSAERYAAWRSERERSVWEEQGVRPGERLNATQRKRLERALELYPADLLAALCAETGTLQRQGWSEPPGSEEIVYYRCRDAMTVSAPVPPVRAAVGARPRFALLALATGSRGTSALPPLQRVFPQGRLFHRGLASVVGKQLGGDEALAATLLGRVEGGAREADHQHAHLLPLRLGADPRLDHVLVYVPEGLDAHALEALRRLHRTWMKGGAGELQVALAGFGDADALRSLPLGAGEALSRVLGPRAGAREWVSATPYVAPRLLKRSGKNSLEGLIQAECARRGLGEVEVARVERLAGSSAPSTQAFVLHDQRHAPPYPMSYALHLRFVNPVVDQPICLGYGAHAGLGRFEAA